MGCVSSLHKPSAMKVHLSSCSNRKPDNHLAIPPSPIKERPPIIEENVAVKPQWPPLHSTANFRDFGSKEEKFFDSQAWLESDCDDDFMSVNGEFTPSRGNTPVHHNFRTGSHEPSMSPIHPSKKKKRLSELFQEGLRDTLDVDEKNGKSGGEKVVAGGGGGGLKTKRERWVESVQMHGCLPSLVSSCRLVNTQEAAHVARK